MARPRSFDEGDVLAKAQQTFWKNGYTATSIQDLEDATGLKRSSLYQAFTDKRTLYGLALSRYQGDTQMYLREVVRDANSFSEAAERMLTDAIDQICVCPDKKGCFIANATAELSAADAKLKLFVADNRRQFVDILLPLAHTSTARLSVSPEIACNYVFTLYAGIQTLGKSGASRLEMLGVAQAGLCGLMTNG